MNTHHDLNTSDLMRLQQGVWCGELYVYFKKNYLYVKKGSVRIFGVSLRRLMKSTQLELVQVANLIIKNPSTLYLEDGTGPTPTLVLIRQVMTEPVHTVKYRIKLKEINNYLEISETENANSIISKQREKIGVLLKKLEYYESKYPDVLTDEEFL